MNLSEAILFTCADHYLQIHPSFLRIIQHVEITTTLHDIPRDCSKYTSWLAKGAHWFTVLKHEGNTLVYCHAKDMMFYASPNVQLHPSMPDGHAFLAQTAVDNEQFPRLLILDMIAPLVKDPVERGRVMRSLAHLFPTTCHVQWAGELQALRKFLSSGAIPHPVESVVAIQSEPLRLLREHMLKT